MPWYHLHTDESHLNQKYLTIGGIQLTPKREEILSKKISLFRIKHKMENEFKWKKISKSNVNNYKEFLDIFFDDPFVRFHCIIFDVQGLIWQRWLKENKQTTFYKAYYRLIRAHISFLDFRYKIYCDEINGKTGEENFQKLRIFVNKAVGYPKWNRSGYISTIIQKNSKDDNFIQIIDILIGAIGAKWNSGFSSQYKQEVINYIEKRIGASLTNPLQTKKFKIWVMIN